MCDICTVGRSEVESGADGHCKVTQKVPTTGLPAATRRQPIGRFTISFRSPIFIHRTNREIWYIICLTYPFDYTYRLALAPGSCRLSGIDIIKSGEKFLI